MKSAFPEFMKRSCNAVALDTTTGMEGYVYEGVDGTQMVIWECPQGGKSEMHVHDFDEYAIVIQGTCVSNIGDKKVTLTAGDECFIPAGTPHDGVYSLNYRAIDAFGAKRVVRRGEE